MLPVGKVWIAVSEKSTIRCCFEEEGKRSIWDEKDENAGASGSQEPKKTTEDSSLPGVTQSTEQASSFSQPVQQGVPEVKDEDK